MPNQDSRYNGIELSDSREILVSRLEQSGIHTERFLQIHDQKANYERERYRPENLTSNKYGVMGDGKLVILDIDDWDETPESIKKLVSDTPTFSVKSPHADGKEGHYYFKCNDSVSGKQPDWGEIRSEGLYVLGPGSILKSCDKSCHDCSLPGHGIYSIRQDRPIATIQRESLPIQDSGKTTPESSSPNRRPTPSVDLPEYEEELADVGRAILRDLKAENTTSHSTLTALLEGGASRYSDTVIETDEEGEYIDREQQENLALLFLYGTIQRVGNVEDDDRAKRILFATFDDYMQEYPRTNIRQRERKWIERGSKYKANRIGAVIEDFDKGKFIRFLNINNTPTVSRLKSGKCSDLNINFGRFAVDLLSGLWNTSDIDTLIEHARSLYQIDIERETLEKIVSTASCEDTYKQGHNVESIDPLQNREGLGTYPTNEELFAVVNELGSSISSKDSFSRNVLSELQETGMVKQAKCPTRPNGERRVYYPSSLPDPDDALWVRTEGEQSEKV